MTYIQTGNNYPGIRGLMEYKPSVGKAMNQLAEALLVEDSSLSRGERELIAAFVSSANECAFCTKTHASIAEHLGVQRETIDAVIYGDYTNANLPNRLVALLSIAMVITRAGTLPPMMAQAARSGVLYGEPISDEDIYYTVAIASAFNMFNRFVRGLGAESLLNEDFYNRVGKQRASEGYLTESFLTKREEHDTKGATTV